MKRKNAQIVNWFLKVFLCMNGILENPEHAKYEIYISLFTVAFNTLEIAGSIIGLIANRSIGSQLAVMFVLPGFLLNTATHWIFKLQKKSLLKIMTVLRTHDHSFRGEEIDKRKEERCGKIVLTIFILFVLIILFIPIIPVYTIVSGVKRDFQYEPTYLLPFWYTCTSSAMERSFLHHVLCWKTETRGQYTIKCAVEFVACVREWLVFLGNLCFYLLLQTILQAKLQILVREMENSFVRNDQKYEERVAQVIEESRNQMSNGGTYSIAFLGQNINLLRKNMLTEETRNAKSFLNRSVSNEIAMLHKENVKYNGGVYSTGFGSTPHVRGKLLNRWKEVNNNLMEKLRIAKVQYDKAVRADFRSVIVYYQHLHK